MRRLWVVVLIGVVMCGVGQAVALSLDESAYVQASLSVISLRKPTEVVDLLGEVPQSLRGVKGNSHRALIVYLLSREPRSAQENRILFQYAVYFGDLEVVRSAVRGGVSPDVVLRDLRGKTQSSPRRVRHAEERLPAEGARAEEQTIFAQWRGQPRRLIDLAAERGHWEMVELLLSCGVTPTYQPGDHLSILGWAMTHGNKALYERLVRDREAVLADPTALWAASGAEDYLFYVSQMIEIGFSVDSVSEVGFSLLETAVIDNRPDLLAYLLQRGADVTHCSPTGETAMEIAIALKRRECEALLKAQVAPPGR